MKTAKQEAIEKAYVKLGFNWEEIKNDVDVMGCLLYDKAIRINSVLNVNEIDNIFGYIRPKSLKGIEDNNGWIRIESEDDLPKDAGYCDCIIDGELSEVCFYWESEQSFTDASGHMIKPSHYIMKTKPNPHIY